MNQQTYGNKSRVLERLNDDTEIEELLSVTP